MKTIIQKQNELNGFAKNVIDVIFEKKKKRKKAIVVGLEGDLGSGKTAFTKAVAKNLGVLDIVTSPTFVIEKIYKLPKTQNNITHLIHIDAYRIENDNEMKALDWNYIISDPQKLIIIEWPEKISKILPKDIKIIKFLFINETTREVYT